MVDSDVSPISVADSTESQKDTPLTSTPKRSVFNNVFIGVGIWGQGGMALPPKMRVVTIFLRFYYFNTGIGTGGHRGQD